MTGERQGKLFDVVLCAISMGHDSGTVLNCAVSLARAHAARLRLLHVFKPGEGEANTGSIEEYFQQAVPQERRTGLDCEFVALAGDVAEQMALAASEKDTGLVVMGFHGNAAFGPSCIDRIAAALQKPVLGVPATWQPGGETSWSSIVVAQSGRSEEIQSFAGRLAESSGARLVPVHVVEDVPEAFSLPGTLVGSSYRDSALQDAAGRLEAAFGGPSPASGVALRTGDAPSEVAGVAEMEHADLVVVGFRPDSAHLTGSMFSRLLGLVHCPVLAVPRRAEPSGSFAAAGGRR